MAVEFTQTFDPGRRIDVLGVSIHDVNHREALDALVGFIESGGSHRVVTPNPEIVMVARRDPGFRKILNASDLSIPDGIGLMFAALMEGNRFRQHVRGTDLVLALAERSASAGWRWFLLGAADGVAAEAGAALMERFPGLQVVGAMAGAPDPIGDEAARQAIRDAGPVHVLLVAYGAPQQERWIARNQDVTGVPVQIGVGGVLNFFSGRSPRAPMIFRRLELEWAYRLVTEPWRWRRQLALPAFAMIAFAHAITRQRRQRSAR